MILEIRLSMISDTEKWSERLFLKALNMLWKQTLFLFFVL